MGRSFVIAAVMTALVAGIGFVAAPKPRAGEREVAVRPSAPEAAPAAAPEDELASAPAPNSSQATPASGKRVFYQWTDERGSVRFARSLEEVPPAWREKAGQVEVDASTFEARPARTPPRAAKPARRANGAASERPRNTHDVTVYTAPWCGWCRKTLAFLDQRGIDYVNKDIEADEEWAEELREKSGGSIPFVEIDGAEIRGYNPSRMTQLLQ
jgi:glutaredoxin